jgi:hypothetical protein
MRGTAFRGSRTVNGQQDRHPVDVVGVAVVVVWLLWQTLLARGGHRMTPTGMTRYLFDGVIISLLSAPIEALAPVIHGAGG